MILIIVIHSTGPHLSIMANKLDTSMNDVIFANQLCALKQYVSIIRDKKSLDPIPPRIELELHDMKREDVLTYHSLIKTNSFKWALFI